MKGERGRGGFYSDAKSKSSCHLIGPFARLVDEVIFEPRRLSDDFLRQATELEPGRVKHAQQIDGRDVEELGAFGEDEDPDFEGGGGGV